MKICANCGTPCEDHMKFCQECGTPLPMAEVPAEAPAVSEVLPETPVEATQVIPEAETVVSAMEEAEAAAAEVPEAASEAAAAEVPEAASEAVAEGVPEAEAVAAAETAAENLVEEKAPAMKEAASPVLEEMPEAAPAAEEAAAASAAAVSAAAAGTKPEAAPVPAASAQKAGQPAAKPRVKRKTRKPMSLFAVLALIFGIIGVFTGGYAVLLSFLNFGTALIFFAPSALAVIFGLIGMFTTGRNHARRGKILAFVGLVLGVLAIVLWIIGMIYLRDAVGDRFGTVDLMGALRTLAEKF